MIRYGPMARFAPALALALAAVLGSPAASGQDSTAKHVEWYQLRAELYTGCKPVSLTIEDLPSDAMEIGLTEDRIQFMAESRLRAARLYANPKDSTSPTFPQLYINVNVVGRSFHVSVDFELRLMNTQSEFYPIATTWRKGVTGSHSGDSEYVVSNIPRFLDEFITKYQRANEDACNQ